MRSKAVTALALAALLTLAASALGSETRTPETRPCANVAFTPNSDDMAANIRVSGRTCRFARGFVRHSKGQPGTRFRGFKCTRSSVNVPDGLSYRRYRCTRDGDVIRWRRY